jgi:hypothetical protein
MASEPLYAKNLRELRAMSDEEVIAAHDALLDMGSHVVAPNYYARELARREQDRQTSTVVWLTWAITALTVVNVAAVIYSIAR